MNPLELLEEFYPRDSLTGSFIYKHSESVANASVKLGQRFGNVDLDFLYEASMIHDIAIFKTKAHDIGCFGHAHYICHGVLGEKLLTERGYPRHGSVCRTHVGVGITAHEIHVNQLPLPAIDMTPLTVEEEIIAYADKYYSKRHEWLTKPKPLDVVLKEIGRHGKRSVHLFMEWHHRYGNL